VIRRGGAATTKPPFRPGAGALRVFGGGALPCRAIAVSWAKREQAMSMRDLILYVVIPFNVILILVIYYWFF